MKAQKRNSNDAYTDSKPVKAPKNARYASKKNYFSRNKDGAVSNRNRDRRLARAARRKSVWATAAGKARKFAKMNTPEKLAKQARNLKARDARRRERKLAEQHANSAGVSVMVQTLT
jgi:hypothetical protein